MKKLLFLLMLLPLGLCAQVYTVRKYQNDNIPTSILLERDSLMRNLKLTPAGVYEREEIVYADSASAQDLYLIVMETLSDWTGTDGRIDAGLDFCDKEAGMINYKGKFSLGFRDLFLGAGFYRYADFIIKVRCKDGRARIILDVPSVTAIYNKTGMRSTSTIGELINQVYMAKKKERGMDFLRELVETSDNIFSKLKGRLENPNSDVW